MTQRTASRLAWSVWLFSTSALVGSIVLHVVDRSARHPPGYSAAPSALVDMCANLAVPLIGAVLASRRRENLIGWLFCLAGVGLGIGNLGQEYAAHSLYAAPGSLPAQYLAAWLSSSIWPIPITALAFLLLLFPTGRLPSARWRAAGWLTGAAGCALLAFSAVSASLQWRHPFQGSGNLNLSPGLVAAFWVSFSGILASMLVCAAAAIVRYRRSRGEERQQLKWFVFAAAIVAVTFVPSAFWTPTVVDPFTVALLGLWVAIAVAILKYRLYDIDRLINRALVYGVLTAVLAGVYVGLAVGLGSIVGRSNSFVIAGSTLVVAALFRPARHRIQGFIDRRFYRRRYDAVRPLEAFSARLRDEVDLESLTGDLLVVVHDTVQPANASMWLRGTAE
jgi:hypothetical protein